MLKKLDSIKDLKKTNLDSILKRVHEAIDNKKLIQLAKNNANNKYVGVINNNGSLEDIKKTINFSAASSSFGNVYGKNITALWNVRPWYGMDLFTTDDMGILRNSLTAPDAKARIKESQDRHYPVYYFLVDPQ